MNKLKLVFTLFLTFAKIGAFTFGGGYAMIPLIEKEVIERKKWISEDILLEVIAIAESTPGPIAINCATFVGYSRAGFAGALAATVGVVVPSFVIIFAISMFLDRFLEITVIANAFRGIKIGVGLLILNAALNMLKKAKPTGLSRGIVTVSAAVMLLILLFSWNFSSVSLMLMAGAVGLAAYALERKGGGV